METIQIKDQNQRRGEDRNPDRTATMQNHHRHNLINHKPNLRLWSVNPNNEELSNHKQRGRASELESANK